MRPQRLVDAVLFDTFGTAVDWRTGVAQAVSQFTSEVDPNEFALAWRGRYQPSMAPIRAGEREFVDLDVLHRENLEATAAEFGLDLGNSDPSDVDHLNRAWHRLSAWPDSTPGLTELKREFIVGPLSNGHTALLTNMAKHAGLPWDVIIGSDFTRTYKPDPNAYLRTAEVLRLPPHRVMLCAAHNADLAAAKDVGFRTAFIPRPTEYGPAQREDLHATGVWDVLARDVVDLATQLREHASA
ncbi:haloacid dehalogenase type II [Saccharopolyspora rhizosphaerae]|uniref:Haloacid dehalogenase type II n=1 Tax=Saccharopolyspora rhizosphaerae TaxID=2492662 RepID=A0A3R8VJK2_9PSEU|nr:haloacid dehalogenase type II [Saccharopolyspora rhizosphaerae]RRO18907.1 haloacid dehalogenase type II [Saccharopolyspora rhizosphaerae]